ncbi:SAM domain-containing protein SAMSN-1b isoform X1 [Labrus mixtus]|uniref:SAM domain-containing protein SAMSN-1b isoform X1 n=1 Tax=Labrus mixtus TaxID=508554 RepID=UPI0029BFC165|nr:SAM domain-containing protein SAMSN-1b isoform X1 [Labrus mixtus]
MNLFCFTLEGSSESIYEPAYSKTLKEVLPRYQTSPALLRQRPDWSGSDLSISSDRPQSTVKLKRTNRRSYVPTSSLDNETLVRDIHKGCLVLSGDKKDSSNQIKAHNREKCKASSQSSTLTRNGSLKELRSDSTETHPPAQGGETTADIADSYSTHTTGRIKKLQNLVHTKKGQQSAAGKGKSLSDSHDHLADVFSNNNPVLTCIGLGRRTDKTLAKAASSPQQQQQRATDVHVQSKEEGVWWSPFECPQPWSPFYHTCQQPQHELWVCGGSLSLPWTTDWDRFESLIQELDSKQPDLCPPPLTVPSITELQFSQNTLTRFGRFEPLVQPLKEPQDDGSSSVQIEEPNDVWVERKETQTSSQSDRKHVKASPEKTKTTSKDGNTQRDEAEKRKVGGGAFVKAHHRRSGDSLESLYSLNSGQSSSSGVTSGSGWSSNRDSLRLDDDLLSSRHFCGRARVHTDFVPSPYDTESLKLKVGDVIDIFAKPPMGIWTGMLNGKLGNFKFIYVDELAEERPDSREETQTQRESQKSTVQEVLRRLSLEEYTSSLQLNGYQTVDDLMRLREHHLTELNVTDPEHRHRLLTAVDSLQQMYLRPTSRLLCFTADWQPKSEANQEAETPVENMKAEVSSGPRDSGCHMSSDSPDNSTEDAHLHFFLQYPPPAETAAS